MDKEKELKEIEKLQEAAAEKDAQDAQLEKQAEIHSLIVELQGLDKDAAALNLQAEEKQAAIQSLTVEFQKLHEAAAAHKAQVKEKKAAILSLIAKIEKLEEIQEVQAMFKRRRLRS